MKSRFSRVVFGLGAILAVAAMAADQSAAPPTWWKTYGIKLGQLNDSTPGPNPAGNSTVVTIGQLKDWAIGTQDYLDSALAADGGAGQPVADAINALDDSDPSVPTTVGQFQGVMQPIYDRLIAAGYDTKASLQANGAGTDWAFKYPWADSPAGPEDPTFNVDAYVAWQQQQASPADLSQAKLSLSFDVNSMTLTKILLPNDGWGLGGRHGQGQAGVDAGAKAGDDEENSALAKKNAAELLAALASAKTASTAGEGGELALVVLTPLE